MENSVQNITAAILTPFLISLDNAIRVSNAVQVQIAASLSAKLYAFLCDDICFEVIFSCRTFKV